MKPQTTPGPWTVSSLAPYSVYAKGNRIADCREANCVCYTERDQANARLIAAAPELLEAAKEAQATGRDTPNGFVSITHEAFMALLDAIAKAEGSDQ